MSTAPPHAGLRQIEKLGGKHPHPPLVDGISTSIVWKAEGSAAYPAGSTLPLDPHGCDISENSDTTRRFHNRSPEKHTKRV